MSNLRERKEKQFCQFQEQDFYKLKPAIPNTIMIELSNACNHACLFCTNTNMKRKVGRIDDQLLDRVLVEAREAGVNEVGFFTTGEPFVHKGLAKYTARAKGLGFDYIYVTTNGALATPDRIREVVQAGMTSIKFSVNAGSRETYRIVHGKDDWDVVIANIKYASKYRQEIDQPLALYVGMVVTEHTRNDVSKLQDILGPYVDDILPVMSHDQYGQMTGASDVLLMKPEDVRKGICPLPFNRLHVSNEGYLTMCCTDFHNYLAVADLNELSLTDAWNSPEFQQMRKRHVENDLEGTLCGACWNGSHGDVKPLNSEMATEIDFVTFNEETSKLVEERKKS